MSSPKNRKTFRKKKLVINPHCTIIPESGSFEIVQTFENIYANLDEDVGLRLTPPISYEPQLFKSAIKKNSPIHKKTPSLPIINENSSFFSNEYMWYAAISGFSLGLLSSLVYGILNQICEVLPFLKLVFSSTIFSTMVCVLTVLTLKNIFDGENYDSEIPGYS